MLKLYQSNRLERLVDLLAAVVSEPLDDPLAPEIIAVQHPGMARWLSLRLAERLGICANVRFPLPAGFVWRIFRGLLEGVPEHNGFEPAVLGWRILGLLEGLENSRPFAPVHAYLAGGDDVKRYELARRIAAAFDQYLVYRPDWITAWEQGGRGVEGDAWQAELWRRLAAQGPGTHWVRLQQRLYRLLDSGEAVEGLPPRVVLFGTPTLSPGYLEILRRLSERMDVHLFLLNPCAGHWTDIVDEAQKARREQESGGAEAYLEVGNPLLASWGRQGRDFFAAILDYDPGSLEAFEPPGEGSLLHRIQSDILHLRDRGPGSGELLPRDDPSLQFHSCHSAMREVEVLKDQLLELFRRNPDLEPSDVLVMTPDIDDYAPYVEAVFSAADAQGAIPWQITDRSAALESPLIAAFFNLLKTGRGRFDANGMLALLEVPAIRRRFGLAEGDLGLIARWVEQSGIRWGRDGGDRADRGLPDTDQNSWRAGLDRLLLGYALPGGGERLFQGILPYDEIEGAAASVLGGLHAFAGAVFGLQPRLACDRPVEAWGRELLAMLDDFFLPSEDEEAQAQGLRDAVEAMLEQVRRAGFGGAVSVDLVCGHLESQLAAGLDGGRFLSGGVTFCALAPMRSLPYQVICLIGMNDGRFPRQRRAPGFDLMARRFRPGDRCRRADDRYLFLETLISARRVLYISYVGQDIRDNSPIPPSVLVDELLDYLERAFRTDEEGGVRRALLSRHPLQPFSRRYFMPGTGLFSYSGDMCRASRAMLEQGHEIRPFIERPLPEPEPEWRQVELEQLTRFFANPVRYLLQRRLGLYLEEGEGLLEDREPFELDYFTENSLAQRLVEAELAGRDAGQLFACMRAAGELPHGRVGARIFERVKGAAVNFAAELKTHYEPPLAEPLEVDLELGDMRLRGRLDVGRGGLFGYSVHGIWDHQLLGLWLRHLVLNALDPAGVDPVSRWLDKERLYRFGPVEQAMDRLGELLAIYWQGLSHPLRLFPKSGLEYARHLSSGKDEEYALNKARDRWAGERNPNPEYGNPYYQLAFPTGDVLDEEFRELSSKVFLPLFELGVGAAPSPR